MLVCKSSWISHQWLQSCLFLKRRQRQATALFYSSRQLQSTGQQKKISKPTNWQICFLKSTSDTCSLVTRDRSLNSTSDQRPNGKATQTILFVWLYVFHQSRCPSERKSCWLADFFMWTACIVRLTKTNKCSNSCNCNRIKLLALEWRQENSIVTSIKPNSLDGQLT